MLYKTGDLVTQDMERAEVLSTFFTLVLTRKTDFQDSQAPEAWGIVWSKEDLPLVEWDQVRELEQTVHT